MSLLDLVANISRDVSESREDEADIKKGSISVTSPIGRGLIGKNEGDEVEVRTPGGTREYEILTVEFV